MLNRTFALEGPMWERCQDVVAVALFVLGLAALYIIYLIGIPCAWLANREDGVRIWKEQFTLE